MRIIVDGPDGAGKTTLAKKLAEIFNLRSFIHLTGDDRKDYEFYSTILQKENVIFDRSFISEPIYSAILGREQQFTQGEFSKLISEVKESGTFVIICNTINKQFQKDENKTIIKNIDKLDVYYDMIAKSHNFYMFDPFVDSIDQLVLAINRHQSLLYKE